MKSVTLVVPCRNEALRLNPDAFLEALGANPSLALLFVDDGSTDSTAERIARLVRSSPAIDGLYLPRRAGKAEAVRQGVLQLLEHSAAELIGFWDADLATPLSCVPRFIQGFDDAPAVQMVIGSRWPHLGAHIDRNLFRTCSGTLMKKLIRCVLSAPIYDTQCGAKIMVRDLAEELFARPFISPWLFDVELFRRMGKERILSGVKELPLDEWHDVPGSKLTLRAAFRSLFDLCRIACE